MLKDFFLDLLFPSRCPVCDRPVSVYDGCAGFCKDCIKKLPVIGGGRCYKCGRKLQDPVLQYCTDCLKHGDRHYYDRGLSLCTYDDVMRQSVYRLKYSHRMEYAQKYGCLMAKAFGEALLRAGADSVTAVPLHPNRVQKRGFNQAEILAKAFSKETGIPFYKDFVKRDVDTAPLKSMTRAQRQNNLKKAFKLGRNDVKSKVSIVIDDIYTTGSTIDAVAEVLKCAGVSKIYFITIAIGGD